MNDVRRVVESALASQAVLDMHTHLYPPVFGTPVPNANGKVDPNGLMQTCDFVGGGTTAWTDLPGATFVGEPEVVSYRGGQLSLIATATDGRILHNFGHNPGTGFVWSGWQDMGGLMRPSPGAYRWVAS